MYTRQRNFKGREYGVTEQIWVPYNFNKGSDWSKEKAVSYFRDSVRQTGNKYGETFFLDADAEFYTPKGGVDGMGGHCYSVFFSKGTVLYRLDMADTFGRPDVYVYRFKETAPVKNDVELNKVVTAQENLRLRSSEQTSSQIITTMAAGTKVKIVQLGKKEVIDNFSSSWVQVEVLDGGKDRNGNPIKSGTKGWCFGGYLK